MVKLNPNCSEAVFRLYTGNKKEDSIASDDDESEPPEISVSSDSGLMDSWKDNYKVFMKLKRKNLTLKGVSWELTNDDRSSSFAYDMDVAENIIQSAFDAVKKPKTKAQEMAYMRQLQKDFQDD